MYYIGKPESENYPPTIPVLLSYLAALTQRHGLKSRWSPEIFLGWICNCLNCNYSWSSFKCVFPQLKSSLLSGPFCYLSFLSNNKKRANLPHGPCLSTVIEIFPKQACCLKWHSLKSCTSSDAQTGLRVLGQAGHIHSAVLFTTLQPRLYGALQPSVRQGSTTVTNNKL